MKAIYQIIILSAAIFMLCIGCTKEDSIFVERCRTITDIRGNVISECCAYGPAEYVEKKNCKCEFDALSSQDEDWEVTQEEYCPN